MHREEAMVKPPIHTLHTWIHTVARPAFSAAGLSRQLLLVMEQTGEVMNWAMFLGNASRHSCCRLRERISKFPGNRIFLSGCSNNAEETLEVPMLRKLTWAMPSQDD